MCAIKISFICGIFDPPTQSLAHAKLKKARKQVSGTFLKTNIGLCIPFDIFKLGFGLTEEGRISNELKFTQMNIRHPSLCGKIAKNMASFDGERFFCAMGGRQNSTIRRGTCSGGHT